MIWSNSVDPRSMRSIAIVAAFGACIPLFAFVDSMYVHASDHTQDMNRMEGILQAFILDSYELQIASVEEDIAEFESIADLTPKERAVLSKKRARREQHLRKIQRLKTQ